jgi:hypothetical protein
MPFVPTGFVTQVNIEAEVDGAVRRLGPDVVRVRHRVGEDTSGEPAIYFRIVITDSAARRENIGAATRQISNFLTDELQPYPRWGLYPYFSFRSESEQATRNEPEWS